MQSFFRGSAYVSTYMAFRETLVTNDLQNRAFDVFHKVLESQVK